MPAKRQATAPQPRGKKRAAEDEGSQRRRRGQAELDDVVRELDALLSQGPGSQFDATLSALNARIDAVAPDASGSAPAQHGLVLSTASVEPCFGALAARRCLTPRAIARPRVKQLRNSGEDELAVVDLGLQEGWCAAFIAHQGRAQAEEQEQEEEQEEPTQEQRPQEGHEHSNEALQDLLELAAIGERVTWPGGLDARTAAAILKQRLRTPRGDTEGPRDSASSARKRTADSLGVEPGEACRARTTSSEGSLRG